MSRGVVFVFTRGKLQPNNETKSREGHMWETEEFLIAANTKCSRSLQAN